MQTFVVQLECCGTCVRTCVPSCARIIRIIDTLGIGIISRTHAITFALWFHQTIVFYCIKFDCIILYILYYILLNMLCYIIIAALYFCLPNLSGHGASFSSKRTRFQMPRGDALGGQTFVSQAMPSDSSWVCTCGLQVVIVCPVLHLFVWILPCRAPKLLRLCVKSVFARFFPNSFHWCVVLTVCGFL